MSWGGASRTKRRSLVGRWPAGSASLEKRRSKIAEIIRDGFEVLGSEGATAARSQPTTAEDLAHDVESNELEFKSTARYNMHTKEKDPRLEHVIVNTVTGFMNSEGGTPLIGVADDGTVLGVANDYATLGGKGNRDGYELFLRELIDKTVSGPALSLMKVSIDTVNGVDVCRVVVAASGKPVFAKPRGNGTFSEFWVRLGNQTRQLHGSDMVDYQGEHWG